MWLISSKFASQVLNFNLSETGEMNYANKQEKLSSFHFNYNNTDFMSLNSQQHNPTSFQSFYK